MTPSTFGLDALSLLTNLFILLLLAGLVWLAVLFIIDISQTRDAIRRNYPVIGRFRSLFSTLGEFFRQYFFALDREEMPFNRAEREWVARSASGEDNTVAFGSTRNLALVGTPIFANCPYPTLSEDATQAPAMVIGPGAREPYAAPSVFNISAMSYGSLSAPAIEALSKGAKLAGCWLNTGEGGLAPHHLKGGGDIVFQIGTAKYGVRDANGDLDPEALARVAAHEQVKMIELKLSQGAKPGKGGILPGGKVTAEIAAIRGIPVGQDSISPNRHREINSDGELLDMIARLREISGLPVGIKTVIGAYGWLDELCGLINRRGADCAPDFITVDSGDGGTGAAPMPLMDNVGLPVREALPMVVDALARHGLGERIRVIASGKLITPAEVAWAICAGADFVNSARGFMFSIGCIQSLRCHKNTCPTGVATHNPRLQHGLDPDEKAEQVKNFVDKIRYGVGLIAHSCGVANPRALGRDHVRLVQDNGRSVLLSDLHPPVG